MKLLRATFLGIRGLRDLTIDFAAGDSHPHPTVLLFGGPASGKTRILEALLAAKDVLAPYGAPTRGAPWVGPGNSAAKVELTFVLDAEECADAGFTEATVTAETIFTEKRCQREAPEGLISLLQRYEHDPRFGKFEYFPANRTLPPPGVAAGLSAAEQRLLRTTRDPRKYSFVPRLIAAMAGAPELSQRFASTLSKLCPTLQFLPGSPADPLRCFSSGGGAASLPHELCGTETDALILAATAVLVRLDRSILFIDRPELGTEDKGFAQWLDGVHAMAPNAQVILASSSTTLMANLEPRAVVQLGA
jgi:hypothetical protein